MEKSPAYQEPCKLQPARGGHSSACAQLPSDRAALAAGSGHISRMWRNGPHLKITELKIGSASPQGLSGLPSTLMAKIRA